MRFAVPICRQDLSRLSDPSSIKNKIASMGDSGLFSNSKPCTYMPGFYTRRITNKVAVLFILDENEPVIVRICDKTVLYKIITRRRSWGFLDNLKMVLNI